MRRVWEHVHGGGADEAEAVGGEAGAVARERGGVAGDVDHAGGAARRDGVQRVRVAALARRVEHHGVDARVQRGQHVLHVAREERGVFHAVCGGVAPGVLDGLRHALNADHAACGGGEQQRDCAHAAIGVHDGLLRTGSQQPGRLLVQHRGLLRVDLQKGLRADGERHAADRFRERRRAGEQVEGAAKDHVGLAGVDVVPHAVHVAQQRQQRVRVRQPVRRGHDHGHGLARAGHARHDVA